MPEASSSCMGILGMGMRSPDARIQILNFWGALTMHEALGSITAIQGSDSELESSSIAGKLNV